MNSNARATERILAITEQNHNTKIKPEDILFRISYVLIISKARYEMSSDRTITSTVYHRIRAGAKAADLESAEIVFITLKEGHSDLSVA